MTGWHEMYTWPRAPHDRPIIGLTSCGGEVECRFHPIRQQWVDADGEPVIITHWCDLSDRRAD